MIIREELCVGCGRCQPFCPATAIRYSGQKSAIDQDVCYECCACLRCAECPVGAIAESPGACEYPRSVRGYFSDPISMHPSTGIAGRETEESKSNDVTLRCGPGEVGIAIELGRPTLGVPLRELQKVTRALARAGIHKIERNNPVHSMLADAETGDLKRRRSTRWTGGSGKESGAISKRSILVHPVVASLIEVNDPVILTVI